jgi:hypothetical protein
MQFRQHVERVTWLEEDFGYGNDRGANFATQPLDFDGNDFVPSTSDDRNPTGSASAPLREAQRLCKCNNLTGRATHFSSS